jgi:hypothetical protein
MTRVTVVQPPAQAQRPVQYVVYTPPGKTLRERDKWLTEHGWPLRDLVDVWWVIECFKRTADRRAKQ